MSTFSIRLATEQDTDTLIAIAKNEWRAIYDGFRPQLGEELFSLIYPYPLMQKEAQIRQNVASGCCYVTIIYGQIAAFIHYAYDEQTKIGTICNNAVSSAFRGKGIGGRQYEFIFDLLKKKGALAVRVTTGLDEAHAPARRAYEKAGFSASLSSITYYKML